MSKPEARARTLTISPKACLLATAVSVAAASAAQAQPPTSHFGEVVPRDVREMYDRGLQYLATTQSENGDWPSGGSENGPARPAWR